MPRKPVQKNYEGKPSADELINSAIAKQNTWMENRRTFARSFLKRLNLFARPAPTTQPGIKNSSKNQRNDKLSDYWFPILCVLIVVFVAIWVAFVRTNRNFNVVVLQPEDKQTVQPMQTKTEPNTHTAQFPAFDIVRIDKNGNVIIAGYLTPNKNVSIVVNGKIIATEHTDENGDFVYAPKHLWAPGNYTISLIETESGVSSEDKVFVFISEHGYRNSLSLLMTKDGSTLLQSPSVLQDGDLKVSKIDYLDTGRIIVTGDALPRLRVSLALDGKYMGFARVSDYKHYGLGADVGELKSGQTYKLDVRLHDGDGATIRHITHEFEMPEMTGDDDTFYTVRRGDCLWVIARNFLRKGVLFSVIAEKNNIANPHLIFPKQNLQIPTKGNHYGKRKTN